MGKSLNILYAGIHDASDIYRDGLKKEFPFYSITVDLANSDNTLWCIEEVEAAYEKSKYDLCILLAGNLLSIKKDGIPLINFKARMEAVCKLISDLATNGSKVIVVLGNCTPDEKEWPDRFITAGASVVYCDLLHFERLIADLPAIVGWDSSRQIERIVQ